MYQRQVQNKGTPSSSHLAPPLVCSKSGFRIVPLAVLLEVNHCIMMAALFMSKHFHCNAIMDLASLDNININSAEPHSKSNSKSIKV